MVSISGENLYLISAQQIIDGKGSTYDTDEIINTCKNSSLKCKEVKIAPFSHGWNEPLPANYLKSACAPLQAIENNLKSLQNETIDILIVSGSDMAKTDFANNRNKRNKLLKIYGNKTFLEGYELVTKEFLQQYELSRSDFQSVAEHFFKNHTKVRKTIHNDSFFPNQKWFNLITEHFRGVDCANPSVDFEGKIVIGNKKALKALCIKKSNNIKILGVGTESICDDGIEHISKIATYKHLANIFEKVCDESNVDFRKLYLNNEALLEVYTCYPIVPLAFLLSTKFLDNIDQIVNFLENHQITISGGLNLGKAPWNNTTLSHIITMFGLLHDEKYPNIGGIHSNAALGYKQGFMILKLI